MSIPIIIFHLGNQEYLKLCLKQASKYNDNIINVNLEDNMFNIKNVKCVSYKSYSKKMSEFEPLYKHYSTNPYKLELICIVRWMCVYEYMLEHNINRAFICDSDILIYENISHINDKYLKEYDFMLNTSSSKNVSGSGSIWNIDKLKDFIDFIFNFYNTQITNIERWKDTYNEPGGICDMTLLYYFCHSKNNFVGLRLPNYPYFKNDLTQVFNDEITFDNHLATFGNHMYPDDYNKGSNNNKDIKFQNGKPYCFCKHLNKDIRFALLHFQGTNKKIMPLIYKLSN